MKANILGLLSLITLIDTPIMAMGGVLDATSRNIVAEQQMQASQTARAISTIYYPLVVRLANEAGMDELAQAEAIIYNRRDDLVLAAVPSSHISLIDNSLNIISASVSGQATLMMDMARPIVRADELNEGLANNLPDNYRGKGVVVGVCDMGFDPNHITFLDAEGNSRVAQVVNYQEKAGRRNVYEGSAIATYTSDDSNQTHATHVMGIITGAYADNPYHGVAPEATIVATTSQGYDLGLLSGADDIIRYATEHDMPAVINISMGNYLGPHDGSTLFNQYLSKVGRDAIVCVAAGNNGSLRSTIHETFTPENDHALWTRLVTDNNVSFSGTLDIWGSDSSPVTVSFAVYDNATGICQPLSEAVGTGDLADWQASSPGYERSSEYVHGSIPGFADSFEGYIYLSSENNTENNRHHINVKMNYSNLTVGSDGKGSKCLAVILRGDEGDRGDMYLSTGVYFEKSPQDPRFRYGDASMSINDLACGENIVVVGNYVSRNQVPLFGGGTSVWDNVVGEMAESSGYGTLPDGRVLPNVSAPGTYIVSAMSTPYYNRHPNYDVVDRIEQGGKTYAWLPMAGTSMATPMVAGVIATWLQAMPSLTIDQALETLQYTGAPLNKARRAAGAPQADPHAGSGGLIDAVNGLEDIMTNYADPIGQGDIDDGGTTGIDTAVSDSQVAFRGGILAVRGAGTISITAIDGSVMLQRSAGSTMTNIDLKALLPAGVYVANVNFPDDKQETLKIKL